MNNKQTTRQKQKSLWPSWFPYPRSWLRALGVAVWAGIVLKIGGFWGTFLAVVLFRILRNPIVIGLVPLTIVLIFSYTHHLFWGKTLKRWPSWFPGPHSLWEGLYALVVTLLAAIPALICVLPFCYSDLQKCETQYFEYFEQYCYPTKTQLIWFGSTIWFIAAAYLYQVEWLIRRHLAFKKKYSTPK